MSSHVSVLDVSGGADPSEIRIRSGELVGKVALVTGAGSGIGYAIAECFAREGAAVAIDYLEHGDDARALAEHLNGAGAKAVAIEADVTEAAAVEGLVARVLERFGRLDVLVNNAGIEKSQPLLDIDEASWDRTLAVDLKAPFLCIQSAARRMKDSGGGSIVNISSIHEDVPFPSYAPYAVAKGGLGEGCAPSRDRAARPDGHTRRSRPGRAVSCLRPVIVCHRVHLLCRWGNAPTR